MVRESSEKKSPQGPSQAPSFVVSAVKWVAMTRMIVANCSMQHSGHSRVVDKALPSKACCRKVKYLETKAVVVGSLS